LVGQLLGRDGPWLSSVSNPAHFSCQTNWCLLLISGSAASFIVMMLPPTSSRKAVRLRNASAITGISEIYGFLISTWIGTQTHQKKTLAAPATWMEDFRIKLIGLSDQIQTAKQMTELAKWEGNIRGKWPIEEYQALIEAELQMISGLAQVLISVIRF
jgi:hypothetical protein